MTITKFLSFFKFFQKKPEPVSTVYSEMDKFFTQALETHNFKIISSMIEAGYKTNEKHQKILEDDFNKLLNNLSPYIGSKENKLNPIYESNILTKNKSITVSFGFWSYIELISKYDVLDNFILNNLSKNNNVGNFFNVASSLTVSLNKPYNFDLEFSSILSESDSIETVNKSIYGSLNRRMFQKSMESKKQHFSYMLESTKDTATGEYFNKQYSIQSEVARNQISNFDTQIQKLFSTDNISKINYLAFNKFKELDFDLDSMLKPTLNIPVAQNNSHSETTSMSAKEFHQNLNQFTILVLNRIVKNLDFGESSIISEEILDGHKLYTHLLFNNCAYQYGTTPCHYNNDIGNKVLAKIQKEKQYPLTQLISIDALSSIESQIKFMNDYIKHFQSNLYINNDDEKKELALNNDLKKYLDILHKNNNKEPIKTNESPTEFNYKDIIIKAKFSQEITDNLMDAISRKEKIYKEFILHDNEIKLLKTIGIKILQLVDIKDFIDKDDNDNTILENSKVIYNEVFQLELSLLNKKSSEMLSKIESMQHHQTAKRSMLK